MECDWFMITGLMKLSAMCTKCFALFTPNSKILGNYKEEYPTI